MTTTYWAFEEVNVGGEWRSGEVVAWTEHDGPGRPPRSGGSWAWIATAATLGVVLSAILFTDALCPEHRAWVQVLGTTALVGAGVSMVGMLRGWASAPTMTVFTAFIGAVIGVIDAVHEPVRGGLITAAFGVAVIMSGALAYRQLLLRKWDRAVLAQVGFNADAEADERASRDKALDDGELGEVDQLSEIQPKTPTDA